MEKIINRAIDGEWKNLKKHNIDWDKMYSDDKPSEEEMILDPLFWQSLGKACGWREFGTTKIGQPLYDSWKYHALLLHEINLNEGWEAAVTYLTEITK